jgi:hypothetical protein
MLAHLHYMTNGVHSEARPRGLHPAQFGPLGSGWHGIADILCPPLSRYSIANGPVDVIFWCILGVEAEDELRIHDKPSITAAAGLPREWAARLLDRPAFAGAMGRIKSILGGGIIWAYIGAPTSADPDPFLLQMVRAGLIGGVIFDATALTIHPYTLDQFRVYQAAGAKVAYEAITKYGNRNLWADPSLACCASITNWNTDQSNIAPHPPHPNRLLHHHAMQQHLILLDQHGATPLKINNLLKAYPFPTTVATNLLLDRWAPPPPPAGPTT